MPKQAKAKRDGVINPQNYNWINLNTENVDALGKKSKKKAKSTQTIHYRT